MSSESAQEPARGSSAPPGGGRRSRRPKAQKKRARARRSRAQWAGIGFGAFAFLLGALLAVVIVFSRRHGPGEGQRFVLTVPEGTDSRSLSKLLAEEGLISSESMMAMYLELTAQPRPVPGEHLVFGGVTPAELTDLLGRTPTRKSVKLTIPEGFHSFAIADRLEELGISPRDSFLRVTRDPIALEELGVPSAPDRGPPSAEGFLYPATYELKLDTPARDVVARLVRESNQRWDKTLESHEAEVAKLAAELGWGRREIVTMASLIEKEAAVDDERATIASVFRNRLLSPEFTPKLLQSDPTSAYGCWAARDEAPSCAEFSGKVTPAMNRDKLNRWSTYTHEGLPPGPICSPGQKSILAVLAPADTEFLYFVAAGGGRHKFSKTLDEHNQAINKK